MEGMPIQYDGSLLTIALSGINGPEPLGSKGYAFSIFCITENIGDRMVPIQEAMPKIVSKQVFQRIFDISSLE